VSARPRVPLADALTYLAACLATAVAARGMWRFFGDVLAFPPELRVGMFAFIEVAVLASAVWALTSLSPDQTVGATRRRCAWSKHRVSL
jgi:hypothetical protein